MKLIDHAASTKTAIDNRLDDLLAMSHQYRAGYSVGRGYSGRDSTCRDFQTPTHFDWKNGALDGHNDEVIAKAIADAVDTIPNAPRRWNTALAFEARNLASRAAVWSSPVLPTNRDELEVLVLEARTMLLDRLRRDGVLT